MRFLNLFISFFTRIFSSLFATNSNAKNPPTPPVSKPKPVPKPVVEPPTPIPTPEPVEPPTKTFELPDLQNLKIDRLGSGKAPSYDISNGVDKVHFKGFKRGFYTVGNQEVIPFIAANPERLEALELSDSAINVIQSVSDNEGNLDAINTWDNSFLTFGMFQWSLGPKGNNGELPALMAKVKRKFPAVFEHYFGQFGLDVSDNTSEVYGYFVRQDKRIDTVAEKDEFRTAGWGYRFWLAGQHPDVQAIQVEHAIGRLKTFYWKVPKGWKNKISEVITSEYGVALILDNHVNRPGYVDNCLMAAWKRTGLGDPENWTTADERKVIDAYIDIRETYGKSPMTDAALRAKRTKNYLDKGIISQERHSFTYSQQTSRGLEPDSVEDILPTGYDAETYDEIRHYDEEN